MNNFKDDPFVLIQAETIKHRLKHRCDAYPFSDGLALIRIAKEQQPYRILELGTALGYTACCLAYGSPQALVDTIEEDAEHVRLARHIIKQEGFSSRIAVHHGNFDTVLTQLHPDYDMAFFDGLAPSLRTISYIKELLVIGGILICSNLNLGYGHDAHQLFTELSNQSHWQKQAYIDNGDTAVLVKLI